jgi:hypothetical protein
MDSFRIMANFIDSHPISLKKGQIPPVLIKLDVKVARNSIIETMA